MKREVRCVDRQGTCCGPLARRKLWGSADAPCDPRFVQIIRAHFHLDPVTQIQADEAFAHFPRDGRQDDMFVVQFDSEHGSGQDGDDLTFYLDVFFHEFVKRRL